MEEVKRYLKRMKIGKRNGKRLKRKSRGMELDVVVAGEADSPSMHPSIQTASSTHYFDVIHASGGGNE